MKTKTLHYPKKKQKYTREKPVSLAGPSFDDILGALLKTEPTPKEDKKKAKNLG
jgi:hypothetical protein